ncbi:hypothetical protein PtA15_10A127 [Puccinia triticina]|uniref:Uncharacterized protein n=1 Tax=Puccinia triticina TaxID=208348 RepID=A0ABY7CWI4_9BASI|nr:uncharacterized protein PtA15_10A127 [Puccinia triticina]WAQ88708.1 hypothetical protein PtA15_10A127 [Puccinia triticina]
MRLFDHPLALDWTCRHQDRPLVVEIGLEVVAIGMDPFVVGRDSSPLEWTPSCWIGLPAQEHNHRLPFFPLQPSSIVKERLGGILDFVPSYVDFLHLERLPWSLNNLISAPPALCNRLESLSRSPDNFVTTLRASAAPLTTSPSHPSLSQYLLPSPSSPSTHLFFYIYSSPAKVSAAFAAVINHHVCKRFHFFEWVKLHGKCELVFYVPPQSHLFASAPSCFVESSSVLHLR